MPKPKFTQEQIAYTLKQAEFAPSGTSLKQSACIHSRRTNKKWSTKII